MRHFICSSIGPTIGFFLAVPGGVAVAAYAYTRYRIEKYKYEQREDPANIEYDEDPFE